MRSIKDELRRFVVENFLYGRDGGFSDTDSFLRMGIIDSTGMLELVAFLERKYSIHLDDSDLIPENLDSISQLSQFVQKKLQHKDLRLPITAKSVTSDAA